MSIIILCSEFIFKKSYLDYLANIVDKFIRRKISLKSQTTLYNDKKNTLLGGNRWPQHNQSMWPIVNLLATNIDGKRNTLSEVTNVAVMYGFV